MGGNSSTRRVSFEADENDNITVVKGIRLSENVINRMREPAPSPTSPPLIPESSVSPAVKEEQLRKRISDELEIERAKRDTDLHKKLEQDKAFVREEISKVLERERAAANESISRAVLRETVTTEEERLKTKRFETETKAKQLEEKDRDLRKQDAYYKEQLARLEERSAQFYKVTTEQYQKSVTEVEAKFKRYESHPVCADLQGEILRCYQESNGQTLSCSALARQYLQCVNNAKQSMLRKGG
ncbi:coiled-coil-helix-coiled-coil-helix domain containing 3a isoform X1 [Polyodon spathula]|uniref:coiled-coil-helix-coiled-coil-helix domain containing 3a isoform X1 n=1 Tax=Polyodon spathula TaxID=7913 RepID=UPI001B7E0DD1|nr:coiled-coil-helix-coiled-coil-helix domain containing 3a isoform X1 [Polyodon spathula]